jgi:hypothetical protein
MLHHPALAGFHPFLKAGSVRAKRKSVFASIAGAIAPRCVSSGQPTLNRRNECNKAQRLKTAVDSQSVQKAHHRI